jgi:hypothetical protein
MSRLTPAATARSDWPERGLSQAAARPQTRAARQFQTSTTCHALRVGTTRAPSVHRRIPKRQRAGALQDASRSPGPFRISARFWTAAALRRFSPSRPSQTEFRKKANTSADKRGIRNEIQSADYADCTDFSPLRHPRNLRIKLPIRNAVAADVSSAPSKIRPQNNEPTHAG